MPYDYFVLRQLFDLTGGKLCVVVDTDVETSGVVKVGRVPETSEPLEVEVSTKIGGYALVAFESRLDDSTPKRAWLLGLGVVPKCRGRNYGRELLKRALDLCRTSGIEEVVITVRPTNESAYRIYKDAGFREEYVEEHYFGENEPRQVLVKILEAREGSADR